MSPLVVAALMLGSPNFPTTLLHTPQVKTAITVKLLDEQKRRQEGLARLNEHHRAFNADTAAMLAEGRRTIKAITEAKAAREAAAKRREDD